MEVDAENNTVITKPRRKSNEKATSNKRTNLDETSQGNAKRKKYDDEEFWSYSNAAETECLKKFEQTALKFVSREMSTETLNELKDQSELLKRFNRFNEIETKILVDLINCVEAIISNLLHNLNKEIDLEEINKEEILAAYSGAIIVLTILTSQKMPEKIYIEDTIIDAINLTKYITNEVIFPQSSKALKKQIKHEGKGKSDTASKRSRLFEQVYSGSLKLFLNFAQLIELNKVPEIGVHTLASLAISTFFVDHIGTLQQKAVRLATVIFSRFGDDMRSAILTDIVNSFHRQPNERSSDIYYSFQSGVSIRNSTILIIQLIQSLAKMPRKRKDKNDCIDNQQDKIVKESCSEIEKVTGNLLQALMSRFKPVRNDNDICFQESFEKFINDLIVLQNTPECPAVEITLKLLSILLIRKYRDDNEEINIRLRCLEYLGRITAEMRKNAKNNAQNSEHLAKILEFIMAKEQQELEDGPPTNSESIKISNSAALKKLEQSLVDYLEVKNSESYNTKYAIFFYAAEWYSQTMKDVKEFKKSVKESKKDKNDKVQKKLEKKQEQIIEKGDATKEFILSLIDRKHKMKRAEYVSISNCILNESDALWVAQYIASNKKDSNKLFKHYLSQILYGVAVENNAALRTQATKCLSQIIEVDQEIFAMNQVFNVVVGRLLDTSPSVRESAVDLLGKFLITKQEFVKKYYTILLERMKDSSISVRKRVIRIIREICEKYPNFEKLPEMLAKLVRRIDDEPGIRKLVIDIFTAHWFSKSNNFDKTLNKVVQIIYVTKLCIDENNKERLANLLQCISKEKGTSTLNVFKEIVDSLVDNFIALDHQKVFKPEEEQSYFACLSALCIFSKIVPEFIVSYGDILQPYLTVEAAKITEQKVVNEVISMLEIIITLVSHPNEKFLRSVEERLAHLVSTSGIVIVESSIRCSSVLLKQFPKKDFILAKKFLSIIRDLNYVKSRLENERGFQLTSPIIAQIERSIVTIGLLARYFDFDAIFENDEEVSKNLIEHTDTNISKRENHNYRDNVFSLICYFLYHSNQNFKQRAFAAIGHFCIHYVDYLAHPKISEIYSNELQNTSSHLSLKVQALRNLEMFLSNEDIKAVKSSEEWEKNKDKHNLKEMELTGSGLSSSVIQIYWKGIMKSYFNSNEIVRKAAVQVISITMNRGLIPPSNAISTLLAISVDSDEEIRFKSEIVLKEIDCKYAGMILTNAIAGVRKAFILTKLLKSSNETCARGFRLCDSSIIAQSKRKSSAILPKKTNNGQANLQYLYQILRENRFNRRTFLSRLLGLFREDSQEKLQLEEYIFVADNIAMFPYQIIDEPLYVLHLIDGIISLFGQSLLSQFKKNLTSTNKEKEKYKDDDELFKEENLIQCFPENKTPLYELMFKSQACFILMSLKYFLMKLFRIDQTKVKEYSPSEPLQTYEKPVTRRNVNIFEPKSALEEFLPEVIEERNTPKGAKRLANTIIAFRNMMLSIEEIDDEESDLNGETKGVVENADLEDD